MLVARYVSYFRRLPRFAQPRTFTEKLLIRLLFDRDPRLITFADKVAVRDYVNAKLGGVMNLTTLYAVIDEPSLIRDLTLPDQFVMKPNHLSHAIKIVKKGEPVDRVELEALARSWLSQNYGIERGEWAYRGIPPRVMFEEFLDVDGHSPVDYKFHCFDGRPRWITVIGGRFWSNLTCDLYDIDFRLLPIQVDYPRSLAPQVEPPPNFDQMLEIAAKLSTGVDHVRVDLYSVGGRIVFGELTNYPGAGLLKFDPPIWDFTFGEYWSLPDYRARQARRPFRPTP